MNNKIFAEKQAALQKKIAQQQEEIAGLKERIKAAKRERRTLDQRLASISKALKKGVLPPGKGLELEQQQARIDGNLVKYDSDIKRLKQSILEVQVHINESETANFAAIHEKLQQQQLKRFELAQKIVSLADVLTRTDILSPVDGTIVNLRIHTKGGVVGPGQTVLEILPLYDEFIIKAYVRPRDIDNVHVNMPVEVRFTAVNRHDRVPLEGFVKKVSADRLPGPDGQPAAYYHADIELLPGEDTQAQVTMVAGMGVEVFMKTGAYSPLEYLLGPIIRNFTF